MQDAEPARWLPLAAAAAELGISVDTARRRLRKGQLAGEQRPTAQGFTWWVCIGAVAQVAASPTQRAQAPLPGLPELVALVDRLQRENRDLAGLVGGLQQRLVFAEDRIRALEAPREPSPAEIASAEPTASARVEVAQGAHPGQTRVVAALAAGVASTMAAMAIAPPPKRPAPRPRPAPGRPHPPR